MKRALGLLLVGALAAAGGWAEDTLGPTAPANGTTVAPSGVASESDSAAPAAEPIESIDLLQAVEAALLNNPELGISEQAIRKAAGRRREANGALLPPVSFTYNEIWQEQNKVALGGGAATTITPGNLRTFTFGTEWVVFAGGALRANQAIARIAEVAAGHQHRAAVNQLLGNTVDSYLQLLRAQELTDVTDRTVALAKEQVRVATDSYEAGAVPRVNKLRAEAALQNAMQAQLQAANGIELAAAALNNTMGRSQLTSVRAKPIPHQLADSPDLLRSLQLAVSQRAELRAVQKSIDINQQAVKAAAAGYWPTVVLNADYQKTMNSGAFGNADSFQVVGVFKLNLWDWYQTSGKVRQAKSDMAAERYRLERTMQNIELQVRSAVVNISSARRRVTTAEAEVKAAGEALSIEEVRYTAGEGIYLELLDARRALSEAETNLVTAYYDNALAEAAWLTATGGFVSDDGQVTLPTDETLTAPEGTASRGKNFDDLLADYGVTPAAEPSVEASDE